MTTTTPSISYFGSRAGHLIHQAADAFRQIGLATQAAVSGLRQEVPFERWFFNHGFEKPIENTSEQVKARAWALASACESALRASVEAVAYAFSLVFDRAHSHRHLDVLKTQGQSLSLSLLATISPNTAKKKAHNQGGHSLIGQSLFDWKWGTLYTGKL